MAYDQTVLARGGLVGLAMLLLLLSGCGARAKTSEAKKFDAYPLYWLGERFERWKLEDVLGLDGGSFVTLVYGSCTPRGGEQPSCSPPLQIQLSRLCLHLEVVTASQVWMHQSVRGAPLARNPDGAPVLLTRRVQVKVYRGEGSDSGIELRALRALRSLNAVSPVVGVNEDIPSPGRDVLLGRRSCSEAERTKD
jgi:hypothetical protein